MSSKVEIVERKDPIVQLEASKSSIKDLFSDLLNETKGFKYQINVKVVKKYKLNEEIEFAPVYFNSETKTVINHRFRLENSFQKLLYIIDVWINKGSGWNVESIESQYINISKLIKSLLSILLILKKLQKKIKSFLVILIMMELSFPCNKKILARLR